MAVKASDIITLSTIRDVKAAYRFYKLQSSTAAAPSKPTALGTPPSGWSSVEPSYTQGSTNSLYTVDLTVFTDNTFSYSEVSLSSSYEAAKAAYNKAVNVETSLAVTAQGIEAKVAATYTTKEEFNNLEIGGRNLFYYSVLTEKIINGTIPLEGMH